MRSTVKSEACRATDASDRAARRAGSRSSATIASANGTGSRGGTKSPVDESTDSEVPPTADTTCGTPHAIASNGPIGNDSQLEDSTYTSSPRRYRAGGATNGRNVTPVSPAACAYSSGPSGPSPAITSEASG